LTNGERSGRVLERNDPVLARSKLGHIGMLLELQAISRELNGGWWKEEPDSRGLGIGNLEVHVALDLHWLDTTIAEEFKGDVFFNSDVYTNEKNKNKLYWD
jgi:hypothetical protein